MRSILLAVFAALPIINAAVSSPRISTTGRCGANFGLACSGSSFGNCCSQYGYCGKTSDHCGTGCQSGYGSCNSATAPSASPAKVSKDGSCGGNNGYTCLKSAFGNCCSQHGYCGGSNAYCGSGCNTAFGTCSGSIVSSSASSRPGSTTTRPASSATPSSTQKVSTNARCGNKYNAFPVGMTCQGSKFGNCCSDQSYCGSTDAYCGTGCQPGFGNCKAVSASSSVAPSSTTSSSSSVVLPSTSSSASVAPASTPSSSSSSSSIAASSAHATLSSPLSSEVTPSTTTVSSTSQAASSSTVLVDTATISSTPASSVLTSSSSVTSASICTPQPTNPVQNPGFESSSLAPWAATKTGNMEIASPQFGARYGAFSAGVLYDSVVPGSFTLTQTGISIKSGTTINCKVAVLLYANTGYTASFALSVDGLPCGDTLQVTDEMLRSTEVVTTIGAPLTVTGDTHILSLVVNNAGSDEAGRFFRVDDFDLTPIAGPDYEGACASSTSVLPATQTVTQTFI